MFYLFKIFAQWKLKFHRVCSLYFTIESLVRGQPNFTFQPRARGGHFKSNERYQNQALPQQSIYDPQNYSNYRKRATMWSVTRHKIYSATALWTWIALRFANSAMNYIVGLGSSNKPNRDTELITLFCWRLLTF